MCPLTHAPGAMPERNAANAPRFPCTGARETSPTFAATTPRTSGAAPTASSATKRVVANCLCVWRKYRVHQPKNQPANEFLERFDDEPVGCDLHKAPHNHGRDHGRDHGSSHPGRYVIYGGWQLLGSSVHDHINVRGRLRQTPEPHCGRAWSS